MTIENKNIIDRSGTRAELHTENQLQPGQSGICTDARCIVYRRRTDAPERPGGYDEFWGVGSAWYDGAGTPYAELGKQGDYYLDVLTGDVYAKVDASFWLLHGNIRGPQGVPGDSSYKSKATGTDAIPDYLQNKIMSTDGSVMVTVYTAEGGEQRLNLVAASTTSGAPNGQELWPFAVNQDSGPIVSSGPYDTSHAFMFITQRTITARRMSVFITQVGGTWVRLYLLDAAGQVIAMTPRFSSAVIGLVTVAFTAPVVIAGATPYYMGVWNDDSTGNIRFIRIKDRNADTASPLMQRGDPNEPVLGVVHAAGSDVTHYRPWLMVME